ncbi:hypothetical protein C8F01DRAFT_752504 [Mycena amicta]|nr:hypothetical protein C8F01DRAFT_752504 [Mycena amicta]
MTKFNKRLTHLTIPELIAFLGDFGLPVPAQHNAGILRGLVKTHMQQNPRLMRDDDYKELWPVRVRTAYLSRDSLTPSDDNEEPWGGIIPAHIPTPTPSPSPSPQPEAHGPPPPVVLQQAADLQYLQSLDPDVLRQFVQASHSGFQVPNPAPFAFAPALPVSRGRPERIPGLLSSNASSLPPEKIRKIMSEGWKIHFTLNYLTDATCSHSNSIAIKELDEILAFDATRGLVSISRELPIDPELKMTFAEWFQAWGRLLDLIRLYLPREASRWQRHYELILQQPNMSEKWELCLAYDSEVRRRSCSSPIDPGEFHLDIWNECESRWMAKSTLDKVRAEFTQLRLPAPNSSNPSSFAPAASSRSRASQSNQPYSNARSFRDRIPASGSNTVSGSFRCFVCGSGALGHRAKWCDAENLISGRPTILRRAHGGSRLDSDGNYYCYTFNGHDGCTGGNTCRNGKHWCTLCGGRDGHSAQKCRAV